MDGTDLPPHGTRRRYNHRTHPCHEACCCQANTGYQREYRAKLARAKPWTPRTWRQLHLPGTDVR